jgi:branched-chain amino acid transport system substrate-binding protein
MGKVFRSISVVILSVVVVTSAAVAFAEEPISIGVLIGLTGPMSAIAEDQRDGALLGAELVNAAGGVLGRPLKVYVRDTEPKPATMTREAERLITKQKAALLTGITTGANVAAILEQAVKYNVPVIGPASLMITQHEKAIGKGAKQYLHSVIADENIALVGSEFVSMDLGKKRAYIIAADYIYGQESGPFYEDTLKRAGVEVVGLDYTPFGTVDFGPLLAKVRAANPDVLVLVTWGEDTINAINQAYELGMLEKMAVHVDFGLGYTFASAVNPKALPYTYWSSCYYWEVDRPSNKAFVEPFIEKFGRVPSAYSWATYTAVGMWAKAAKEAGTTDTDKVIDAFRTVKGDFGTGEYYFRAFDQSPVLTTFVLKGKKPEDIKHPKGWDLLEIVTTKAGEAYKLTREELSKYPPRVIKWPRS